jgi:hypothetical protein
MSVGATRRRPHRGKQLLDPERNVGRVHALPDHAPTHLARRVRTSILGSIRTKHEYWSWAAARRTCRRRLWPGILPGLAAATETPEPTPPGSMPHRSQDSRRDTVRPSSIGASLASALAMPEFASKRVQGLEPSDALSPLPSARTLRRRSRCCVRR